MKTQYPQLIGNKPGWTGGKKNSELKKQKSKWLTPMNTPPFKVLMWPKGWKPKQLDEILTEEQIRNVRQILDDKEDTDRQKTIRLKVYLNTHRKELEQKEMLPDFLAYLLMYLRQEGKI